MSPCEHDKCHTFFIQRYRATCVTAGSFWPSLLMASKVLLALAGHDVLPGMDWPRTPDTVMRSIPLIQNKGHTGFTKKIASLSVC